MWLKASLLSFLLLLASRFAGLARDAAQAAALGSTGMADVAVLLFTWPDWLAGLLAGGALSLVLLPRWQGLGAVQLVNEQRRVTRWLLACGAMVALAMLAAPGFWLDRLAPGVLGHLRADASMAWQWAALAVPLAFWAAASATRLQHGGDLPGLYASNLVVNAVLIAGLLLLVIQGAAATTTLQASLLAATVVCAGLLRLLWQSWRLRRSGQTVVQTPTQAEPDAVGVAVWLSALGCSAIAVFLPVWARSLASGAGAGELALFHYGWKLVELPLGLVIQLLGVVALGVLSHAVAHSPPHEQQRLLGVAFRAAWVLSLACVAALGVGAEAAARLVFGWGRATAQDVLHMGQVARACAWALPGLAMLSVALAWSAAQQQLARQWSTVCLAVVGAGVCSWIGPKALSATQVGGMLVALCWGCGLLAAGLSGVGLLGLARLIGAPGWGALAIAVLASGIGFSWGLQPIGWAWPGLGGLAVLLAGLAAMPWLRGADAAGLRSRLKRA